jgi:hypothetical protein
MMYGGKNTFENMFFLKDLQNLGPISAILVYYFVVMSRTFILSEAHTVPGLNHYV